MIIPDANLLIYAYNAAAPEHARAKNWWRELMNSSQTIGLSWIVILAFIRITTQRRVLDNPLTVSEASEIVGDWLAQPNVRVIEPGRQHLQLLTAHLNATGAAGNLVSDAHLAALAMEHSATVHSNDADFQRFPGVKWENPLAR
jgi:toxin-antitoxin system PIN domain toxin